MPMITGNWKDRAYARCFRKRRYQCMAKAEEVAQRASRRTGDLIIAYQCFECLRYHVGHADESQKIVRDTPYVRSMPATCPHCNAPIPEDRRYAAIETGSPTVYCSFACQKKAGRKRQRARERETGSNPGIVGGSLGGQDSDVPGSPRSHPRS